MKTKLRNQMIGLRVFATVGLAALGMLLAATPGWATTTSGVLTTNEVWRGSVELTGDVTVPTNITLTILPGTRVACYDYYDDQGGGVDIKRIELIVNGALIANGDSANPIVFTSSPLVPPARRGDWFGIRLLGGTNGASILRHCVVEYAITGLDLGATLAAPAEQCIFRENSGQGLTARVNGSFVGCSFQTNSASGASADVPAIVLSFENCALQANGGHGLAINTACAVGLTNSTVAGNAARGVSVGPADQDVRLYLTSCAVTNNGGEGVFASSVYWAGAYPRLVLRDSLFASNAKGLYCEYSALRMQGCSFRRNNGVGTEVYLYTEWRGGEGNVFIGCSFVENASDGVRSYSYNFNYGFDGINFTNCSAIGNYGDGFSHFGRTLTSAFVGCRSENNSGSGIRANSGLIQGCTILSNGSTNEGSAGALLFGNSVQLSGNEIRSNRNGIVVGTDIDGSTISILSNAIAGNVSYELKNLSAYDLVASHNFWAEPTTTELRTNARNLTLIYDKRDNPALGLVVMYPYLTNDPTAKGLIITQEPQDRTVWESETATFTVAASSPNPITYQWRKAESVLAGKTNSSLVIGNAQLSDAATNYNVVVADGSMNLTSRLATLVVRVRPATILTSPVTQTVGLGSAATFTVTASGTAPLYYQWYFNNTILDSATAASLAIPAATADWAGNYRVVVWNSAGTNWSAPVSLWLDTLKMYAGVNVFGPLGSNCLVQFTTNLTAPVQWFPLQSVTIVTNPTVIIDFDSPGLPKRFYRTLTP